MLRLARGCLPLLLLLLPVTYASSQTWEVAVVFTSLAFILLARTRNRKPVPSTVDVAVTTETPAHSNQTGNGPRNKTPIRTPIRTKVRGVAFSNDDGTSRQEILKRCRVGEPFYGFHPTWLPRAECFASEHGDAISRLDYQMVDGAEKRCLPTPFPI